MQQTLAHLKAFDAPYIRQWENMGGQIMPAKKVQELIEKIKSGAITSWQQIHRFYDDNWQVYPQQKFAHALHSLLNIYGLTTEQLHENFVVEILKRTKRTAQDLLDWAFRSREKDYENPFRLATYESKEEMEAVLGNIETNSFLQEMKADVQSQQRTIDSILSEMK